MPVAYFDSSVLLSFLLGEARASAAASIWNEHGTRVSSLLLGAECWTGMRRHFLRIKSHPPAGWMQERSEKLEGILAAVELKPVDAEIMESLRQKPDLGECRTLDAIHLATALFFQSKTDEELLLISFDERMRLLARKMKMKVLPA